MKKKHAVFVINLARSKDRWEQVSQNLKSLGVDFERLEATDAKLLTEEEISKYYSAKLNYHRTSRPMTKAEIACYISHIRCWRQIVERNLDFAVIIEDDIVLDATFLKALKFLQSYEKELGYLQLGSNARDNKRKVSIDDEKDGFQIVRFRRFTGYNQICAVSRRAAETLLKNSIPFGRPVDTDAIFFWQSKVLRRGLRPWCFVHETDIFGTQLPSRNVTNKVRASFWTRSFCQDPYFWFWRIYYAIARGLGARLSWEWWDK